MVTRGAVQFQSTTMLFRDRALRPGWGWAGRSRPGLGGTEPAGTEPAGAEQQGGLLNSRSQDRVRGAWLRVLRLLGRNLLLLDQMAGNLLADLP